MLLEQANNETKLKAKGASKPSSVLKKGAKSSAAEELTIDKDAATIQPAKEEIVKISDDLVEPKNTTNEEKNDTTKDANGVKDSETPVKTGENKKKSSPSSASSSSSSKKRDSPFEKSPKRRSLSVGAIAGPKSWTFLDTRQSSQSNNDSNETSDLKLVDPSGELTSSTTTTTTTEIPHTTIATKSTTASDKTNPPSSMNTIETSKNSIVNQNASSTTTTLTTTATLVKKSTNLKTPAQDSRGRRWMGGGSGVGWADRVSAAMLRLVGGGDGERQGWIIKATSAVPGLPKPKHVRNLCIATWDGSLGADVLWSALATRPWKTQPIVAMKVGRFYLELKI
jgi:hypothetical protein